VPTEARVRRASTSYVPRRPHDTVLHRLVREHYATFVAHTEATYAAPLPRYVKDAFERYLACGDFSQGFVRCHCDGCGHDVFVAFSCKQRGLCPSCGTRRMCDEAANITDRVVPSAPVRQWVMSLPFELRGLAATKPDVLTALGRIFAEEVARATKRLAGVAGAETGAVSFPQRFGGSLNLHVHFHLLGVDAVFEKHGDGVRLHDSPPPAKADVVDVVQRVHDRVIVWLRRHRYLDERSAEERGNEPAASTPLDALARIALAGGTFLGQPFVPKDRTDDKMDRKEPRFSASLNGFDVHCAVRVAADDDEGRERLIRYCARPPFGLDRIEELKDGRVSYLMKTARRGSTHRVMTPMEFMGRLAILVPPPYFPLVRYHGVFAARSSWRALVTPKPPDGVARRKKEKPCASAPTTPSSAPPAPTPQANVLPSPPAPPAASASPASTAPPPSVANAAPIAIDATTITVKHWRRILDGELFATSSRVDWAVLMQRSFGFDALRCPTCHARMRVISTLIDPAAVKKILVHLGVPTEPLPRARARDPTGQLDFGDYAA
jgi:Putative transposase/Transposase zinc-binding domain